MMQAMRYGVVFLTAFIAGSRAVDAARSWSEWQSWTLRDPSAAQAYRTFFLTSSAIALVSLTIAALVWWLLGPKQPVERKR